MLAVLEVMLVDREMIKRLIASIYVSALVPVGYTIFEVVTHHAQFTSGGYSRFEGTFSQPNPFAIYLTMLIVMGAALFPHLTQRKKIGMSVLLFLSLVCLYYTFTRSAWIATVIGLFAVAIMGRRRLMLGIMVGGIMVSLVALPSIAGRFADLGSRPAQRATHRTRCRGASATGAMCCRSRAKDPITGIGLNMSSYETSQQKEPHNDFLRAYVETGIIGTHRLSRAADQHGAGRTRLDAVHQATSVVV